MAVAPGDGTAAGPPGPRRDSNPALDFGLSKYAANCRLNFLWNRAAITVAVLGERMGRAA